MIPKLNPHEAPEGYIAEKATMLCGGCAFSKKNRCLDREDIKCTRLTREDKCLVIFKKKEDSDER